MEKFQPQDFANQYINYTNRCVFLTGKAGTGKTTFLKQLIDSTHKQAVIVAPTGIAALNAGGVTIHSFFQLPFSGFIPDFKEELYVLNHVKMESKSTLMRHFRFNKKRQLLLKSLELLIIDEVSMLRADLLDAIDWTLRNIRKDNTPFGGVQVLFIGDLFQLPPVVKNEEWTVLNHYYKGIHFFNSLVLQEHEPIQIELTKIYRQSDSTFIDLLNQLRTNTLTQEGLSLINTKVNPTFDSTAHEGYITLTTHNHKADTMNQRALSKLTTETVSFKAEVTNDFPPHIFPIDVDLHLKKGAQVMFIKNDLSAEKQFYNGKMAIVTELSKHQVVVECVEDKQRIVLQTYEWENIKYTTDLTSGEIKEEVIGTFVQYPIKLAWAITVHKSQGLTFDKAVLDVSEVFASGQAYVALSRLRTFEGLVMLTPMGLQGIQTDREIIHYSNQVLSLQELESSLPSSIKMELYRRLLKVYDWLAMASLFAKQEKLFSIESKKSVKGENYAWMVAQNFAIQSTIEPARKFRLQLEHLFHSPNYDPMKVLERVNASVKYFFPIFDTVYASLLKKMMELNRAKKAKAVVEELEELEEALLEVILELKKTEVVVEHTVYGKIIDKKLAFGTEIANYKIARIAKVKHTLIANNDLFIATQQDDDEDSIFFKKENKKKAASTKEKKKSTSLLTLDLYKEGLSVATIAQKRQLSTTTIYGHLAQLIKDEHIGILDVMEEEVYQSLKTIIGSKSELTLTEMKELVGDDYSYNDLRMYQSHLLL